MDRGLEGEGDRGLTAAVSGRYMFGMRNVRGAAKDAGIAELEALFPDIIRVMSGVRELVHRAVPAEDRRSLRISVSPRGERYLAGLEASIIANYRRLLGSLPPAERSRLVEAFRAILDVLGGHPSPPPPPRPRGPARTEGATS